MAQIIHLLVIFFFLALEVTTQCSVASLKIWNHNTHNWNSWAKIVAYINTTWDYFSNFSCGNESFRQYISNEQWKWSLRKGFFVVVWLYWFVKYNTINCALKENKMFEIQIIVLLLRGVIVINKLDRLAFFM